MNLQICLICVCIYLAGATSDIYWLNYKSNHAKKYSAGEDSLRYKIWSYKMNQIKNFSAGFVLKMNKFGDMTQDEVNTKLLGFRPPTQNKMDMQAKANVGVKRLLPTYVDWRNSKMVTPVKDQTLNSNSCSCCYVFAASASLEGQWAKRLNTLMSMSEQDFLDCSSNVTIIDNNGIVEPKPNNGVNVFQYNVYGCKGGNIDAVFEYSYNNGYTLSSAKPYTGKVI